MRRRQGANRTQWRAVWTIGAALLLGPGILSGCARRAALPPAESLAVASWYGPGFHGRPTASGAIYDQHDLTAAHRTWPLGTNVRVTHLASGRSVVVRINDRGPFVEGREIDLSLGAARKLGMVDEGTARVRLEPFSEDGRPLPAVRYAVQVGSFRAETIARAFREQVRPLATSSPGLLRPGPRQVYVRRGEVDAGTVYRVRVGLYGSREEAMRLAADLESEGLEPIVVEELVHLATAQR
jgi:rare lipoprotein A